MTQHRQADSAARPDAALPPEVVDSAVDWLVRLWSGTATDTERAQWQAWRAAHPLHERAWQRIEATDARLRGPLSGELASATLSRSRRAAQSRRKWLAGMAGLASAGTLAWSVHGGRTWQAWTADASTATGERRQMQLPDGTRLFLNTGTAIDLAYDDRQRRVLLLRGELLVTTAHDTAAPARPFLVETPAGSLRALGTRFSVRHGADTGDTRFTVFEGAVQARSHAGATLRVNAGEAARLTATQVRPDGPAGEGPGWDEGVIVASDMRLDAFVAELRRYRPGLITLSPEVSALRLSGVFPLDDTDRILQSLVQVLPVRVHVPVRYWVRIGPA
ncbi:fec operon regulator FecR [Delftia tsuruhatensis]|uniref:FecR domain-containing protein n=1 Tax=Delftia tsuruhatensis TaxID=180282 RepID=UPI001E7735F1|nr:FecR family protein [Delftia tsuruhatensis]CAB5659195.1 fec operon regulator FecR [Delftia tsuruhatensis]CAC9679598.1 fec operon regulator FecR [Delftia tsuruhatensis]